MFYPNLLRGRHERTAKNLDLGVTQREMLADMARKPEQQWTASDFGRWLGIQPQVARASLLKLWRRGLVDKIVPHYHFFTAGSGRQPHHYQINEAGQQLVRERKLLDRF